MSITASAIGRIALSNNLTGATSFTSPLNLAYAGTLSSYAQGFAIASTPTTISVPNLSGQFLYIKNLASIAGQNVLVTWTPQGGSTESALTLSAGASIIFCESDTTNGITALSLTATGTTTTGTTVEFLLVG